MLRETKKENAEEVGPIITSGCARDQSISLSQTGAVDNHPSLVLLLPCLPNNVGSSNRLVNATLSCKIKA